MSVANINIIMGRVAVATPESQLAVFSMGRGGDFADAVFASTIETQERIRLKDAALIGLYDKTMDKKKVRTEIEARVL